MTNTLDLGLGPLDDDYVTPWVQRQFQTRYGTHITKDDIWEYIYGVMHAPDWRHRYRHDLQRNLPRIPLAPDFEAFRHAGRQLLDLHTNYETIEEWPVACQVDGEEDNGTSDDDAYRIENRMRWGRHDDKTEDHSMLEVNSRCRLVDIPEDAHRYTISGRSPLRWAIDSLRHKHDKASGIRDDPNGWHVWADEPFELIRHLRRLVRVSVETARIVDNLPASLPAEQATEQGHTSPAIPARCAYHPGRPAAVAATQS